MAQWIKNVDVNKYRTGAFCEHGDDMGFVCTECVRNIPKPPNAKRVTYKLEASPTWFSTPLSLERAKALLPKWREMFGEQSRIVTQLSNGKKVVI